jgi:hypothetical protein
MAVTAAILDLVSIDFLTNGIGHVLTNQLEVVEKSSPFK